MRGLARLFWAGLFVLAAVPGWAGDKTVVGHFDNGSVSAEIRTYSDNGTVIAIIAISANGRSSGFVFDRNDWPALQKLWEAAKKEDGVKFVSIGSLAEVGTSEKCVITAAGGPTVRLTVVSPIDGALVFDVPRYLLSEFDAKLKLAASQTTAS